MKYFAGTLILTSLLLAACKPIQKSGGLKMQGTNSKSKQTTTIENSIELKNILDQYPVYFNSVLQNPEHRVQIIFTRIERGEKNTVKFTDHYFNVNENEYFYPASTVKLPVAILALQRLNELNIPGLDKNTSMNTEESEIAHSLVYNDPTAADGRPGIAHYIRKILLVSDNDAFNRLYEFLGQEYINNSLHKMGYTDAQIIHRLEISLTEEQNRFTNAVNFYDTSGQLIYAKPVEISKLKYSDRGAQQSKYRMGKGFYRLGQLINDPFDFSLKNQLTLKSLHGILRSVIFPESVAADQRFNLKEDDYLLLRKYMSMMPAESAFPAYDSVNYWDNYVKFLLYGAEKSATIPGVRIFNKVGDAYGFLIDAAYIVDFKNGVEFMLSAIIHCNSDGIFNDNKYEYDSIGFPFMKHLGQVIYQQELKRDKKQKPDLSEFIFDYIR
ncbi:MAG TPA: serine hydrolase [Chitinophagaceae bacterium]|nr:serine hydrolase [Chitinophagaceae bacterium]